MNAHMGPDLRCPVCQRPFRDITLRAGDAWITCWHRQCGTYAWAVKIPAVQPIARDIELAVGARLAAALLETFAPAPIVTIAAPPPVAIGLLAASRSSVIQRLQAVVLPPPLTVLTA